MLGVLVVYWLLTDWDNVISELVMRLDENREARKHPIKTWARLMHSDLDHIYELQQFTHFQKVAFDKLQRLLQTHVPQQELQDPLWNDLSNTMEGLRRYELTLDSIKERFNNQIGLEFEIQNALQSRNIQFLTIVDALILPVSLLASLFGMSTVAWPPI